MQAITKHEVTMHDDTQEPRVPIISAAGLAHVAVGTPVRELLARYGHHADRGAGPLLITQGDHALAPDDHIAPKETVIIAWRIRGG